jgi:alpha-mannosidase
VHESAWNLEDDYRLHTDLLSAVSVEVSARTPVKGAVRVTYRYHDSVITQDLTLYSGAKQLDIVTHVSWREREKVLRAVFPVNVRARYATFNVAHGETERPTFANNPFETAMFECCAHRWIDLGEEDYGVSLLNNCKYGHSVRDGEIGITLMRGPVCPDPTGDICEQDFTYSLYPHAGSRTAADVNARAAVLNDPFAAVYCPAGEERADGRAFFRLNDRGVSLEAVKQAQDGRGIIVRLNRVYKTRGEVLLTLPFTPRQVTECDLMETDERALPFTGNTVRLTLKPYEVRTLRVVK